ncbi:MAG: O-linked N-acetylglucosamine transferase family protein [Methylovirgula sp.]
MTRTASSAAEPAAAETEFSTTELMYGALEFHAAGNYAMAGDLYRQVLEAEPEHAIAWHHLGLIAHVGGDHATAAEHVGKAIAIDPKYAQAFSNLSAIHRAMGDFTTAAMNAERAIALNPNFAPAHSNLGNAHEDQGNFEEALAAYRDAIRCDPHFVEAHVNAANLLRHLKRYDEALATCETIIEKRPEAPKPYFCAGNIFRESLRPREAIAAYRQAITAEPRFAEAYCNLGNVLFRQSAFDEAIAAYLEAIEINPSIAQTYCNLGAAYELSLRTQDALDAYKKAIALDPDLVGVEVQLYHQRRAACDWDGIEEAEATLLARLKDCTQPLPPFAFLSMQSSPAIQLDVARLWVSALHARPSFEQPRPAAGATTKKLKIGYVSGDFHRHATAHLMAGLFERHDRSRFEIIAYSHGMNDCSEMRYRLGKAFDDFVDLRDLDDRQAAQRIHADGIDILVELKGYTQLARSEIAAHRPAPIQVNFLGYPGTMGADFIDYVIADPITVPMDQQPFYDEKIVHLPDCYQPNDTQRRVTDLTPSRADCSLPEEGFVFCCFNNTYKITPRFFSLWMRLLEAVPGSVLWLFDANAKVKANLGKEAMQRGIDPRRLIFAPRIGPMDHLARQRRADLFLDCLPYNAHTTTSDALWVGLPVITLLGETFAGRVAASLLHAIGMPELVTHSEAEYEALALRLATEPQLLANLRRKLHANRLTHPLFNTERYTRHLEAAFTEMWETWAKGEPPRPIVVTPLPVEETERPVFSATAELATHPTAAKIARLFYAACPLCDGQGHTLVYKADATSYPAYQPDFDPRIQWQACRACGHVFTQGHFAPADQARLRPEVRLGDDMDRGRRAAAPIVARIAHHVGQGPWLDAEFGDGSLLFTAAEWGYDTVGIEQRAANVAALRQLGVEAYSGNLTDLNFKGRFSVVSLGDLLPREPFPKQSLAAAHLLLRTGGILFASMPNREPMLFNMLQANAANPHWAEIDHYHMFGRSRLYRLLRDHGFEPVDYNISPIHRVGMEIIARKLG